MRRRTHKLLLILLTMAMAVAPLRGAWAAADISPPTTRDSSPSHCEQMQHSESADTVITAGHDTTLTDPGLCSGNCCDEACNTCVHAAPAIPGTIAVLPGNTASIPISAPAQLFPERPAIPLLHPPASFHS